jgi:hypothetical protein
MDVEVVTWRADLGWTPALPTPDRRTTLVLAFGDPHLATHPDRPIAQLHDAWRDHVILGCSTAGQVVDGRLLDNSLVVTFIRFDRTRLVAGHVDLNRTGGPRRAGRALAELVGHPECKGAFILSDGLHVNATALVAGIADVLPDLPVSGGLAGDGDRFENTWVIVEGEPSAHHVSIVGFLGDEIELGHGSAGGWDIFGPERVVTRSHGNVLYEIDSRSALDLYKEYLGPFADRLPANGLLFPLQVRDLDGRTVVRTVLAVDEAAGSLTFAGDIPQGSTAQLMRASTDHLVHGAHLAAKQAATGHERVALAVSCVGRRLVMGERTEEELDAALEAFTSGTVLAGFYSYGELSPTDGCNDLHNQTMTITTIAERVSGPEHHEGPAA